MANETASRANKIRQFALPFIALILVGGIFQLISLHFGYKRYLLSVEMFLSFVLLSFGYRWLGSALFFLAVVLEVILGMTSIFILFEIEQVLDMATFLFQARAAYLSAIILLLIFLAACIWLVARSQIDAPPKKFYIVNFALFVALFQYQWSISSEGDMYFSPTFAEKDKLIFGSAINFSKEAMLANRGVAIGSASGDADYIPIQHASAVGTVWKDLPQAPRVLLVIAESWGSPKSQQALETQIRSLRANPHVTNLEVSSIHAAGATVVGELREVCGLIPTRLNMKKMNAQTIGDCLPTKLKRKGYRTVGIHGANGIMYHRLSWWPHVGLSELIFRDSLPFVSSICYSFPGYCDRDIFELVGQKLEVENSFVYWLTLNSHMPYDRRDVDSYRDELCRNVFDAEYDDELCSYHNLHVQFFEGLSKMIENEALKELDVVVVGDHPPVFSTESSRNRFERNRVPTIHFTVK